MLIINTNESLKFIGIEALDLLIKRKSKELENHFYNEKFVQMIIDFYHLESNPYCKYGFAEIIMFIV